VSRVNRPLHALHRMTSQRVVPHRLLNEVCMTGEPIDAHEAKLAGSGGRGLIPRVPQAASLPRAGFFPWGDVLMRTRPNDMERSEMAAVWDSSRAASAVGHDERGATACDRQVLSTAFTHAMSCRSTRRSCASPIRPLMDATKTAAAGDRPGS
jgi:hypothetical protein